ncbi:MAG: methylmalonyl-CoA epimerase [Chloracidobacterium sp. CP2_5A]|nr:MAG: methylmalonyl-CoA epimerase [Chloracidobacterium sp. CP2_5A]
MKIDHLGIAVESIEKALSFYQTALGLELAHTEVVDEQGVRVAMLPIGESRIELLEPTAPDTPVGKFIAKRGGGIHHISLNVDDLEAALGRLKAQGIPLIDETPRIGAEGCLIAFVHPKGAGGVLVELSQKATQSIASAEDSAEAPPPLSAG